MAEPTNTRIWHDRSGQFKVEAQFLGIHNGKIRLHKANGVVIEVPEEKMSAGDMEFIRKQGTRRDSQQDEDNVPLAEISRKPTTRDTQRAPPAPRKPSVDWFEFFLSAGCDMDDCTRYAASFERDKIDEAILPDLKAETLRALGLREGDIIRVMKKIEEKGWKRETPRSHDPRVQEQMRKDAELAAKLQEQEYSGRTTPNRNSASSPGLFAGPGGALKNNTRRGRPQPTKSATLGVDSNGIATASEQLSRTSSPAVSTITAATGSRTSTATTTAPTISGFDDDAWTPRPASAAGKPTSPPANANPPRAPSAPIATPTPPPPPPPPVQVPVQTAAPTLPTSPPIPAPQPTQQAVADSIQRPATANAPAPGPKLADQFDVLAKIGQMRPPSAPAQSIAPPQISSPPITVQPTGYGLGNTQAPFLGAQPTGPLQAPGGPRAPFAPVPSNEGLLKPLIPTTTGFNSFIPTRNATSPLQNSTPSFLTSQPTGFNPGLSQPMLQPLQTNPTGFAGGGQQALYQGSFGQSPGTTSSGFSTLSTLSGYHTPSPIPTQVTGYGGSPFGNQNAIPNAGANFLSALQSRECLHEKLYLLY